MDGNTASDSDDTNNSSMEEDAEGIEDFSNDPLENVPEKTPTPKTKKGHGRPKKGHNKVIEQPKKCYNTRHWVSTSDVATLATSSSNKFVINDNKLRNSGMNTKFKSWAKICDEEDSIP